MLVVVVVELSVWPYPPPQPISRVLSPKQHWFSHNDPIFSPLPQEGFLPRSPSQKLEGEGVRRGGGREKERRERKKKRKEREEKEKEKEKEKKEKRRKEKDREKEKGQEGKKKERGGKKKKRQTPPPNFVSHTPTRVPSDPLQNSQPTSSDNLSCKKKKTKTNERRNTD